jgi:hypothetical protein
MTEFSKHLGGMLAEFGWATFYARGFSIDAKW